MRWSLQLSRSLAPPPAPLAPSCWNVKWSLSRGYSLKNACHLNLLAATTTTTMARENNSLSVPSAASLAVSLSVCLSDRVSSLWHLQCEMHFSFNFPTLDFMCVRPQGCKIDWYGRNSRPMIEIEQTSAYGAWVCMEIGRNRAAALSLYRHSNV